MSTNILYRPQLNLNIWGFLQMHISLHYKTEKQVEVLGFFLFQKPLCVKLHKKSKNVPKKGGVPLSFQLLCSFVCMQKVYVRGSYSLPQKAALKPPETPHCSQKHTKCFVGCESERKSLHAFPASEELKTRRLASSEGFLGKSDIRVKPVASSSCEPSSRYNSYDQSGAGMKPKSNLVSLQSALMQQCRKPYLNFTTCRLFDIKGQKQTAGYLPLHDVP